LLLSRYRKKNIDSTAWECKFKVGIVYFKCKWILLPADEINFSVQGFDLLIPGGHVQLESVPDVRALLQKISISNEIAL
jgi:hypothetical protein